METREGLRARGDIGYSILISRGIFLPLCTITKLGLAKTCT